MQTDLLVFDGAPEAFGEDVIRGATPTIHADLDVGLKQQVSVLGAGDVTTLIAIPDAGIACSRAQRTPPGYLAHPPLCATATPAPRVTDRAAQQPAVVPVTMVLSEVTNNQTLRYLHGLGLVAQSDGASTEYFAYDGLGSVRQVTGSDGSTLMTQTFDPYGNPYVSAGPQESNFGYTGQYQDDNGLLFLRARYYSASSGRFFQMDPSRQEQNPYQYSMSNPIMFTDPSGFFPTEAGINNGTYVYSCLCGWIDWTHAGDPSGTVNLLTNLSIAADTEPPPDYWGFYHVISVHEDVPPENFPPRRITVHLFEDLAVVDGDNPLLQTHSGRLRLAISFFMDSNEIFEAVQGQSVLSELRRSGFAEEDLPSDLLAFYQGYLMFTHHLNEEQAEQRVLDLCKAFDRDASLDVFEFVYQNGTDFENRESWGPELRDLSAIPNPCPDVQECISLGSSRRFPSNLTSLTWLRIYPEVDGTWWWWWLWAERQNSTSPFGPDLRLEQIEPNLFSINRC